MKIKIIIVVFFVEILLSSCGSFQPVEMEAEYSRFDIPETIGKNKFHAGGSISNSSAIVSFKKEENDPVNVADPKIESADTTAAFKGGYGLLDRLDVGVRLNDASLIYVKAMLIGMPFNVAKKGNYSLAVSAGHGKHNDITGKDDVVRFDYVDYVLITGYRFSNRALTYWKYI